MGEIVLSRVQKAAVHATPWAKRRAAISMRIEMAALQLCVDRSIDEVTIDELAAAADISRRTFYHYFESIEDVFSEMPRRSMEGVAREFSGRPASESIVQAYVNTMRNRRVTDPEREIRRLAIKVAQRSPEAYWRAIGRSCEGGKQMFERAVADRLQASGQDSEAASLIAVLLLSITGHVSQQSGTSGEFEPDPDRLEAALQMVAGVMSGLDALQSPSPKRAGASGGRR